MSQSCRTHSEESAIRRLPHTRAHRCRQLAGLALIDRWRRVSPSHPDSLITLKCSLCDDLLSQLLRNLTHVLSFGYLPQRFVKSKIRRCDDPSICSEFLLTHGMLKIKTCCERLRAAIRAFELFLNCY